MLPATKTFSEFFGGKYHIAITTTGKRVRRIGIISNTVPISSRKLWRTRDFQYSGCGMRIAGASRDRKFSS
jgi:hypothetical protein